MEEVAIPISFFDEACANCGQGKSKHTQIQTMSVNAAGFMAPVDMPPLRYCPPKPVENKS